MQKIRKIFGDHFIKRLWMNFVVKIFKCHCEEGATKGWPYWNDNKSCREKIKTPEKCLCAEDGSCKVRFKIN